MKRELNPATAGRESAPGKWMLSVCLALWAVMASAADSLEIDHAWIREAPPGAPMMAGYLCLENNADAPVTLVGVESPQFEFIMMHRTETVKGMARMLHQDKVVIAAGKRVCFEPGGLHLMMPAPEPRLVAGDRVELDLLFEDESRRRITVPVKAP
ncbi:hypothetical protein DFR30_2073 [Thiogranum longum]|uniref:Copper(I)-binding protein n=1 Tax=Thiogranum longum TaxID=1537524 RepID=A0A4R1HHC4_9GAMM|nr:copper chaperone PCu(A)C [Thiogranum longum]TCK18789.1 hypothetical protein DFR30_2073 [Thiogranum longum]